MPAVLALLAALSWGLADFLGGALSRKFPTALVMLWSAFAGLFAIGVVLALGAWERPGAYLLWGLGAGFVGLAATVLFYRALALGTMSIVAPIAGTGLVVPVLAGLLDGERPSALALLGIVFAAVGVFLASGPEMKAEGVQRTSVTYAIGAAFGFGITLALIPQAGEGRWAMTSATIMLVAVVVLLPYVYLVAPSSPGFARSSPAPVFGIGLLNVTALSLYAVSSTRGLVAVVSVLASLYPVVTVVLAQVVLRERLKGIQRYGVAAAFAGVVCLAAG